MLRKKLGAVTKSEFRIFEIVAMLPISYLKEFVSTTSLGRIQVSQIVGPVPQDQWRKMRGVEVSATLP